ncbi:glucans biosynthesis glucosyltransferase MdoH [Entomobacter blattae]|uniref:Glucans biosynthesis glucosyltransferase H n=1 Tax=Entomobacter blattae TaxID=2762277 RepID=A0A7H1NRE6_9PROT|nr:glucans biosynthesis glucosyltransferase MdoH [Entomobacter blattae]QNT78356.1 Glucans biosynthesis glucosyltransferase H [Entomobacter blattae]
MPVLPDPSPLEMPIQSLHEQPCRFGRPFRPVTEPSNITLRRLLVIGGSMVLSAYAAYEMNNVLNSTGASVLGWVILVLFVFLFCWISLAFTSAVAGFISLLRQGGLGLGIHAKGPQPELKGRTAVLMPTYNENPFMVMAGLEAIYESLYECGRIESFDFFILSDTTDPDIWLTEEAAFLEFRKKTHGAERIFYRRRTNNTERKAGNIAEWVKRFGGAYDYMLTLDADSVIDGSLVVRMVAAMDTHPTVGLIQSLPVIVNGNTVFARLQQFAGRVYGPLIAHGIAWWHGAEGNYWGHNALIRTQAFAEQAGLPTLPGRKPFGGHILSHDFVEAALMRRGGWAIHMVPGLSGSYEESPPSLTDIAIRDRRWCQGNLQHAKVIPTKGMHWISRLHMMMGIGSYVTSPLWLIFLLVGIMISFQSHFVRPEYFGSERRLFPHWPQVDPVLAKYMFIATMVVLLVPKVLAYIALLFDRPLRTGCGGWLAAGCSVVLETLIGGLLAPVAMLIQTSHVISILSGQDSGWNTQRREDGGLNLKEVIRSYWGFTVFGLIVGFGTWEVSHSLFLWMTPVLLGLLLAIPLVYGTASRPWGLWLKKKKLLLIPEEVNPPPVLRLQWAAREEVKGCKIGNAFEIFKHAEGVSTVHKEALGPERQRGEPINPDLLVGLLKLEESASLQEAQIKLTKKEKAAIFTVKEGIELVARIPEKLQDPLEPHLALAENIEIPSSAHN